MCRKLTSAKMRAILFVVATFLLVRTTAAVPVPSSLLTSDGLPSTTTMSTISSIVKMDSLRGGAVARKDKNIEKQRLPPGKYSIGRLLEIHKSLWLPFSLAMMYIYDNVTPRTCLMAGLFGGYGINWVIKSYTFFDKNFYNAPEMQLNLVGAIIQFSVLSLFLFFPWCAATNPEPIQPTAILAASLLYSVGMMFHYGADAQKFYTLKYKGKGLITDGFFTKMRNPSYFGEDLIFVAYTIVAGIHSRLVLVPILYTFLGLFVLGDVKSKSLSRYPEYKQWVKNTWF